MFVDKFCLVQLDQSLTAKQNLSIITILHSLMRSYRVPIVHTYTLCLCGALSHAHTYIFE